MNEITLSMVMDEVPLGMLILFIIFLIFMIWILVMLWKIRPRTKIPSDPKNTTQCPSCSSYDSIVEDDGVSEDTYRNQDERDVPCE